MKGWSVNTLRWPVKSTAKIANQATEAPSALHTLEADTIYPGE
jgi:hypothetical protein